MSTDNKPDDPLGAGSWAICELLGHVRMAGYLTPCTLAGAGMLRLDVPATSDEQGKDATPALTQIFAAAGVYRIIFCDEATARAVARNNRVRPVQPYEMPALPAGRPLDDWDDDDDEHDPTF